MSNSIFNLYRGPESQINEQEIHDGNVYFSTDTKSLMVDCDYTDPREQLVYGRFKIGGNTGIHYAQKELSEEEEAAGRCIFSITDFTSLRIGLPELDDLILNIKDGSFYRVKTRNDLMGTVEAERLTISGTGGTGDGSGSRKQVKYEYKFGNVTYGTLETTEMYIYYTCHSDNEGSEVEVDLYINKQYITTIPYTKVSITEENELNLADYMGFFNINKPTEFYLKFRDAKYPDVETTGMTRNVLIYNMYIKHASSGLIPPTSGNYDFVCYPWGGILNNANEQIYSLKDREIYWELRRTGESSIVNKGSVLTNADKGSTSATCTITYPGPGEFTLTAWLQGKVENQINPIRSKPINIEIPFFDENGDPLITTTSGLTRVTQYDKVDLQYMVAYGKSEESTLKLYANYTDSNGIYHADKGTIVTVTNATSLQPITNIWPLSFDNAGTYHLSIVYLNNNREETQYRKDLADVTVIPFAGKPEIDIVDNLKLYLTAKGRQNTEEDRASWTSLNQKTPPFPDRSFTMRNTQDHQYFENFNWKTNGWISDALHLTNGAKVTIPFSPFSYNPLEEGKGLTIELDFKISNVRDANQPAMTCISTYKVNQDEIENEEEEENTSDSQVEHGDGIIYPGVKIRSGIVLYHNKAQLFSAESKPKRDAMSGRTTVFYPGERVRLTYVITDKNFSPNYMVYTYLNGVISGLNRCLQNDTFKEFVSGGNVDSGYTEASFIFDSTYMDIDIYNIRVYSAAHKYDLVLHNDIADSNTPQEAITRQIDNSILDSFFTFNDPNTPIDESIEIRKIDLEEVASRKHIPYMVFYDGRATGSKKDEGWYGFDPETEQDKITEVRQELIAQGATEDELNIYPTSNLSMLPTGKSDYRHMEMYYVDPTRGFIKDKDGTQVYKGTYNIGSPEEPVVVTAYAQGTSSLEYPIKNLRFYLKPLDKFNKYFTSPKTQIETYSLEDRIAPVELFTLKADYMESSSSHNTGTANLLNKLYEAAGIVSPAAQAYPKFNMLTAILGHPIVCFFKPYKANPQYPDYYQYIGRYNFNLDKATHEVFGFESTKTGGQDGKMIYGYLTDANGELKDGFNASIEFEKNQIYYIQPDRKLIIDNIEHVPVWEQLSISEQETATVFTITNKDNWKNLVKTKPLYVYRSKEEGVKCVQCWECLNNPSSLVGMREHWDEEIDKTITYKPDPKNPAQMIVDHGAYSTWTGAFESRYPEYETEASSDKRALSRMLNWVQSTDRNPEVIKKYLLNKNGQEPSEQEINEESNKRLAEFTSNLQNYFNLDYLAFYYVITEALMMIDSRGKNMMLACYDADPEAGTGHWCPIFYDMDTMLGLDNSGNLKFDYSQEDNEPDTFNLAATYKEPQYSVLWTNYREGCQEQIKQMYLRLRTKTNTPFSAVEFRKAYNDNQANAWNETYINEDVDFKFVSPLVNEYEIYIRNSDGEIVTKEWAEEHPNEATKKTAANYLYAAQGTRSQHRDYWLTNRFIYLDSKYGYNISLGSSRSQIYCRVNSTVVNNDKKNWFNFNFDVKSLVNQYITISLVNTVDDNGQSTGISGVIGPEPVYSNKTTQIITGFESGEDQEIYIYDMDNITSLGDLSNKGFKKFKLTNPTKFTDLIFGHTSTEDEPFNNKDLGSTEGSFDLGNNGEHAPLLKVLNIENCSGISNGLSLTKMPYLQELYAKGSKISSVIFADGGSISHLELPATIEQLIFTNQLYYNTFIDPNNLILENPKNLARVYIKNSPNIDTKTLFKSTLINDTTSSISMIYLDNINWEIDATEWEIDEKTNRIISIPLLDILMKIPYGALLTDTNAIDQVIKQEKNNNFLSGTIKILNENTGIGIDELTLYTKYSKIFPGLRFEYSDEGNSVLAYSININNNVQEVIYNEKKTENEILNYDTNALEKWFTPIPLEYIDIIDPITGEVTIKPKTFSQDSLPDLMRTETGHYVYELRGWALSPQGDFCIDDSKYNNSIELRDQAIDEILAIKISHILDEEHNVWVYSANVVNNFALTLDKFQNQVINFYPVYAADLNSHIVYFYDNHDGTDKLLKAERVQYGGSATPPLSPQWLELPTSDITKAYIYPFIGYDLDYTHVTNELKTYATYGEKKLLSSLTDNEIPKDCFEEYDSTHSTGESYLSGQTMYKLKVKKDYTGEAIIIPKTWTKGEDTRPVGQIVVYDPNQPNNYCTTLKRIFFEKDNQIINIGYILDQDATKPLCMNFEYIDFPALKNIKYIFNSAFAKGQKIEITALPENLIHIGSSAFDSVINCKITQLPAKLKYLDPSAFYNCQNIQRLDIDHATELEIIGASAFYLCKNLTVTNETITLFVPDQITQENTDNVGIIGEHAFLGCSKLTLNFATARESNIRKINNEAFLNCPNIGLQNLPQKLEHLGASAFKSDEKGTCIINFTSLPSTITNIGSGVFQNCITSKDIWYINSPLEDFTISKYAFYDVTNLKTIVVPWSKTASNLPEGIDKGWSNGNVSVQYSD